jgi:hypothetical protein
MNNSIFKKIAVIAVLSSAVLSPEISMAAKPCPTWPSMLASLDHALVPVPYEKLRVFFGGKPGHKFDAFSMFAATEFSNENTDFIYESKEYVLDYATNTPTQNRAIADDLMKNFVLADAPTRINLPAPLMNGLLVPYGKLAANTPPPKEFFKDAQAGVLALLMNDTFPRFLKYVQLKGLPSASDANGVPTKFDKSYLACTN